MSTRRDFIGMTLGATALIGVGGGIGFAGYHTWKPLPSVKAAGFSTVDLTTCKAGEVQVEKWRGKPIFILKKTVDMPENERDVVVGSDRYHVSIALCTHLGCIPAYSKSEVKFKCACHGGEFDTAGINPVSIHISEPTRPY
jgi:ubiquinol-cytochrome c reductase iron-sulfur subunit